MASALPYKTQFTITTPFSIPSVGRNSMVILASFATYVTSLFTGICMLTPLT